ncbi:MAG: cupin domain-containing protein [Vicinamibacterales bacterium]
MDDRRTFLALVAALFPASLITLSAQAQSAAPAAGAPRELARHGLTGPLADFDALLLELRPPVGEGREHRHNGPVLGYVLEGNVRFGVNHEPARIVGVGETFFEETGALHSTFGSVEGAPARLIVFMVVPKKSDGPPTAPFPASSAAPPAALREGELARHTLTGPLAPFDVLLLELNPRVGDGREHRHSGPVLGYVLGGKLRFAVNHDPVRIVGVGETFFEETGALHSTHGSVEGSPARAIVFMVVPKGSNGAAPRP